MINRLVGMTLLTVLFATAAEPAPDADHALYAKSLGTNINLLWGAVLMVFGALMVWFARRAMRDKTKRS